MSALDASWSFLKAGRLPSNPETARLAAEAATRAKLAEAKRNREAAAATRPAQTLDDAMREIGQTSSTGQDAAAAKRTEETEATRAEKIRADNAAAKKRLAGE